MHDHVRSDIVVDRFPVVQNYRKGFDSLHKQEFRCLNGELSPETYAQDVKGMPWILRKNHAALTLEERQRLRRSFNH